MVKCLSKELQLELLCQLKKDNKDQAEESVEEIMMAKTRAMRKKEQRTTSSERERSILLQRSSRGLFYLRGRGVLLQRSSR